MYFLQTSIGFTWRGLLLGGEDWSFLPETVLRTSIMFIVIILSLRILGKRGVKQLSVFELVVIISLGSAAGDPMFYKDVGILPAVAVFVIVVALYKLIIYFIGKNKKFEGLLEGKPICLIKDGAFNIKDSSKETLGEDEFFAELRMQGVSQLGQIEEAIIESSGNISIFYFPDELVKFGLPIMPGSLDRAQQQITEAGHYACTFCGFTEELRPASQYRCPKCDKIHWVKANCKLRIR